jgi:hypothetical protein
MLASGLPYKFATPWAVDATTGYLTAAIPATATGAAASQQLGFPPITAAPVVSGGVPPNIADFNGFGYYVTAWLQWLQAGGPVQYDGTFATAIGGYPKGTVISSTTLGKWWLNLADNNSADPDAAGANWRAVFCGGLLNVQYFINPGTATYTPTPGTNSVEVLVDGAGGAAGGSPATNSLEVSGGGGGGAGAYATKRITSGFSGVTVTVGAAGVGNSGLAGGNGGASSFGSLVSANGGSGGNIALVVSNATNVALGGAGGVTGTSGDLNLAGTVGPAEGILGGLGEVIPGAPSIMFGANYGYGGKPNSNPISSSALTGASGGGGIVIVREYY